MTNTESALRPDTSNVTLVVSCYNHQSWIEQCLDSVMAQSSPAMQVIIIDDFSSDGSASVIENWLAANDQTYLFVRHTVNVGVCATLNEALALAEGRYFCHVSGDDWEEPDRLVRQVAALDAVDETAALLIGDIREVDAGGGLIVNHDFGIRLHGAVGTDGQSALLSRLLAENVIPAPGVLIRTDRIREIGGFDPDLAFEDYDLWLRFAHRFSIAYLPGIVSSYRVSGASLSRNSGRRIAVLSSEARMLAKHIGVTDDNDRLIGARLLHIAGSIIESGSASSALRKVLRLAATALVEPWISGAIRVSYFPGGLEKLRSNHFTEFGIPSVPSHASD